MRPLLLPLIAHCTMSSSADLIWFLVLFKFLNDGDVWIINALISTGKLKREGSGSYSRMTPSCESVVVVCLAAWRTVTFFFWNVLFCNGVCHI